MERPPHVPARVGLLYALLGLGAVSLAAGSCDARPHETAERARQAALRVEGDDGADAGRPRSDCYGCHVADYRAAHGPGSRHQVPTTCAVCHRETGYHPIQRVHPWPLTGKHDDANCFDCHKQTPPVFAELSTACVDCHRADYDESAFPGHEAFALTCGDCHGTDAWKGAKKPAKPALHPGASEAPLRTEPDGGGTRAAAEQAAPRATPKPKPRASHPGSAAPHGASGSSAGATPDAGTTPAPAAPAENTAPLHAAHGGHHPEARFPISRGNHEGIECGDCHRGAGEDSKINTACVSCHKRARYDRKHGDVADYPLGDAPAFFCVECHRDGTRRARR